MKRLLRLVTDCALAGDIILVLILWTYPSKLAQDMLEDFPEVGCQFVLR